MVARSAGKQEDRSDIYVVYILRRLDPRELRPRGCVWHLACGHGPSTPRALGLLALEEAIDLLTPAHVDAFAGRGVVLAQGEENELFLRKRSDECVSFTCLRDVPGSRE